MSSKQLILDKIQQNKPAFVALKELPQFDKAVYTSNEKTEALVAMLHLVKTEVVLVDHLISIKVNAESLKSQGHQVITLLDEGVELDEALALAHKTATDLAMLDYAFIKGNIAVCENGAIWLTDKNMVNRLLPFICKHLVLVIAEKDIVANMHEAYERIKINQEGYGVFISGPSKTADIEQSLVIGAHGPLSLKVYIIKTA